MSGDTYKRCENSGYGKKRICVANERVDMDLLSQGRSALEFAKLITRRASPIAAFKRLAMNSREPTSSVDCLPSNQ